MKKQKEKIPNLSYESDGKMGKKDTEKNQIEKNKSADFFNITPDSE
ncbi:hypothetical protein ACFSCX_03105 [Bacillus salitolerans]|uniref:Biofilm-forming protein n=1 Tax=Bacillus salitolerans TaxID=1437434 RepID=A0ABW4LK04_9BACI